MQRAPDAKPKKVDGTSWQMPHSDVSYGSADSELTRLT